MAGAVPIAAAQRQEAAQARDLPGNNHGASGRGRFRGIT